MQEQGHCSQSTVKPAEDGSGDIIVRLYEAKQMAKKTVLFTSLPVVSTVVTNMLEQPLTDPVNVLEGEINISFKPFEVMTLRLVMSK